MNHVDLGQKYKRLVQYLWDAEPRIEGTDSPLWCLGNKYKVTLPTTGSPDKESESPSDFTAHDVSSQQSVGQPSASSREEPDASGDNDGQSVASTTNASWREWPAPFLDDFESKIWLTYRSNFPLIPTTDDDNAPSSRTLSVRLRMQLTNSDGFTTDTGWGCMIRSGQSLLANALSMLSLGRGTAEHSTSAAARN